jgi:hypothetical protein
MTRIKHRRGRHVMDESGRLFWINGPEEHCYLSEQRQWRRGLSFDDILDWKQCAPSGRVSQRFASLLEACEAYEHRRIVWSQDLYLRRMGDQMAAHRSAHDYKPTAMKQAEALGAHPRRAPWQLPEPAGPVCGLPPRSGEAGATSAGGTLRGGVAAGSGGAAAVEGELPHTHRRRRSGR